jgi:hypothetical protein
LENLGDVRTLQAVFELEALLLTGIVFDNNLFWFWWIILLTEEILFRPLQGKG